MIAVATSSVKPVILSIVRGLLCIAIGLAACQAATETSEQAITPPPPATASILLTDGTATFNNTQVGTTGNTLTFAVRSVSTVASSLTINSVTYSCGDYSVDAMVPGYADRECEQSCVTGGGAGLVMQCPVAGQICSYYDYYFTATFHPSLAAATSCVVTVNTTAGSPSITLYGTGLPPPIHVNAGPGSINFGGVRINTASTGVGVTVSNTGGQSASINSVSASAGFMVSGNTGAHGLGAGGSEGFAVTCNPTGVGGLSGNLTVSSNDPSTPTINIPLACTGIDSALAIAPSPAVLPTIRVGESEQQTITLTNMGGAATSIQAVSVTGMTMVSAPPAGTMLAASGGSATVTVAFDGTAAGDTSGVLHVDYDNGKSVETQVTAKAVGTSLSLSPDGAVEFGPICAGQSHSMDFSLIGTDEGSFELTSASTPDAPFTLTTPTLPVAVQGSAANSVKLTAVAAPTVAGDFTASFVLATDIPNGTPHTISLHALGLDAGVNGPPQVDLGANLLNMTTFGQKVEISNCTDSPVTIASVNISGTDAADFAIVDQPMDLTIMPAQSIKWLVVLDPHTLGDKTAEFNANFDGGTTVVPLIGEGLAEGVGSGADGGSDKTSYYACSTGKPSSLWPLGFALLLLRRRRR